MELRSYGVVELSVVELNGVELFGIYGPTLRITVFSEWHLKYLCIFVNNYF